MSAEKFWPEKGAQKPFTQFCLQVDKATFLQQSTSPAHPLGKILGIPLYLTALRSSLISTPSQHLRRESWCLSLRPVQHAVDTSMQLMSHRRTCAASYSVSTRPRHAQQ